MSLIDDEIQKLGGLRPINTLRSQPLSESDVLSVESIIGKPLPPEYRAFATKYGATAFTDLVECPYLTSKESRPIAAFYGSGINRTLSLLWVVQNIMPQIPHGLFPIADDGFGNQICIAFAGPPITGVYSWRHDSEEEQDLIPLQDLPKLADSFLHFFQRLRVIP